MHTPLDPYAVLSRELVVLEGVEKVHLRRAGLKVNPVRGHRVGSFGSLTPPEGAVTSEYGGGGDCGGDGGGGGGRGDKVHHQRNSWFWKA